MKPEHTLAAEFLGTPHVCLKAAGSELGEPHGRVILDPGNGPAFTAPQLAENFIHGIPSERIVQGCKNYVFRQPLMQGLEMSSHSAPPGEHQPLAGRVPS